MSVNLPALERNKERVQFYKERELEEEKDRALKEEAKIKAERESTENYLKFKSLQENQQNTLVMYNNFIEEATSELLSESICQMYGRVVSDRIFYKEDSVLFGVSLINNYIKENGADNILSKMKSVNSLLLVETANVIEETIAAIIESTDKNNTETFEISDTIKNNFYNSLDLKSYDDVADMIKVRVSTATEEFVTMNRQDKEETDQLLKDTKEKVDSELSEATRLFRLKEDKIKNRRKNIYEQMVFSLSESIIKNESLLESYSIEGKLSMESIMEKAEIQYIVLEMLNTIKLEEFTKDSVLELISK